VIGTVTIRTAENIDSTDWLCDVVSDDPTLECSLGPSVLKEVLPDCCEREYVLGFTIHCRPGDYEREFRLRDSNRLDACIQRLRFSMEPPVRLTPAAFFGTVVHSEGTVLRRHFFLDRTADQIPISSVGLLDPPPDWIQVTITEPTMGEIVKISLEFCSEGRNPGSYQTQLNFSTGNSQISSILLPVHITLVGE
jgi:hypothetical protein